MARFSDKRVLVTGGTSGMGLAGARRIVAEGGRVAVTGRDPARVAAAAGILGEHGHAFANDAADPRAASALADHVHDTGALDGLWLNAGTVALGEPDAADACVIDRLIAANLRGPMLQLAALLPHLKPGAAIVVTSSSSTYEGAAGTALYAGTKGALVAMVRSWARSLAPRGIRVNALVPGPIATNLRAGLPQEESRGFEAFVIGQVPLGRAGTAEEAAAVALFLLSDDASYVTGSQYAVDGGLVMH